MERVVFDTNAYRYLIKDVSFDDLDDYMLEIRAKEKKNNLEASISPIVIQELLAHVAGRSGSSLFQKSLNAIKAMYLHCFDNGFSRMLARPEMLVAKYIFGLSSEKKVQTGNAFIEIVRELATSPTNETFERLADNLNKNKEFVENAEQLYADSFLKILKCYDPAMEDWIVFANDKGERKNLLKKIRSNEFSLFLARTYLEPVFNYYALEHSTLIRPDEVQWTFLCTKFVDNFPEYIALYKSVYENIINSQINMFENNRANFWWDTQLMLNVGEHKIENDKLYFVTSDKAMLKVGRENNANLSIFTFDEYMDYLG
ncbi:hypothetical protein [Chryseobacterium sp.]|uniref:hypothetical protein n=1 Tax=Chryseobacterium sp. TaxID=1871047 RepID=UPI0028A0E9AA|nr:hypothetical protein [Chryseobacterium sp.]